MSQLTLTPEEDSMLLDALRAHATQYQAMFGSEETAMMALIAKIEGQLPQPEPVVEAVVQADPPDVVAAEEAAEAHFAAQEAAKAPEDDEQE